MARTTQSGDCYLCGKTFAKEGIGSHIARMHEAGPDEQPCRRIKVEGYDDKDHWLYLDVSLTATFQALDAFLREIWLECCGHLSAFFEDGYSEIPMSRKLERYEDGCRLRYEYDFGSTTRLLVTFAGHGFRPKQRRLVRLLARNKPFSYVCGKCGRPAVYIDPEKKDFSDNPFLCASCGEDCECRLPVTNSPRMGECAYCGDLDVYEFVPEKFLNLPR